MTQTDLCHFIKKQRKEQKELIWTEAGRSNQGGKRQQEGKEGKRSVEDKRWREVKKEEQRHRACKEKRVGENWR